MGRLLPPESCPVEVLSARIGIGAGTLEQWDAVIAMAAMDEATRAGWCRTQGIFLAGIDARTLQRWRTGGEPARADARPDASRPTLSHALTEQERARIVEVANEPRFADTPPARIVPALADEGILE